MPTKKSADKSDPKALETIRELVQQRLRGSLSRSDYEEGTKPFDPDQVRQLWRTEEFCLLEECQEAIQTHVDAWLDTKREEVANFSFTYPKVKSEIASAVERKVALVRLPDQASAMLTRYLRDAVKDYSDKRGFKPKSESLRFHLDKEGTALETLTSTTQRTEPQHKRWAQIGCWEVAQALGRLTGSAFGDLPERLNAVENAIKKAEAAVARIPDAEDNVPLAKLGYLIKVWTCESMESLKAMAKTMVRLPKAERAQVSGAEPGTTIGDAYPDLKS